VATVSMELLVEGSSVFGSLVVLGHALVIWLTTMTVIKLFGFKYLYIDVNILYINF
jgi:hypothetical protein